MVKVIHSQISIKMLQEKENDEFKNSDNIDVDKCGKNAFSCYNNLICLPDNT